MNVLLLVWDTCRRDALEPYGAPAGSTPVVADLARRGVAAPDAHATASWTMPSHASLFTGRLPRELGLTQAPGGTPASCHAVLEGETERLLAERFRRAGYVTAATSANLWVDAATGFDIGFGSFELAGKRRAGGMARDGWRARLGWMAEGVRASVDDGASQQRQTVLGWIEQLEERPFFWFVNLNECHSPYLPPRPWNDLGPVGRALAADDNRRYMTPMSIWRACAGGVGPSEAPLARMRHLYARSVASMDAWLGDVLHALDAAGRLDDTLVVLTSDHGENLGEGGLIGHAYSLDERLTAVPLVAAGPHADRLADVASLADVPRRLAEIVGLGGEPYDRHDASVSQFDPLGPADDPRIRKLFELWPEVSPEQIVERMTTPLTAVADGRHKLVLRGDAEELYDLEADPLELSPGAELPPETVTSLRAKLSPAAERAGEVHAAEPSPEELAGIEDRMRMLGYL